MNVTVITKTRIGFSAGIIASLAIGLSEVLSRTRNLERNEAIVCGGLGLAGLISWIMGRCGEAGLAESLTNGPGRQVDAQLPVKDQPAAHPLAFLWQARYWGVILVISAGVMFLICALVHRKPVETAPPPPPKAPAVEVEPVVVAFPSLKLQGLVNNGTNSTAVINGITLYLGEVIGDVRLIEVGREEVTVELAGQTKVLALAR